LPFRPARFYDDVLTFGVTHLLEPLAEVSKHGTKAIGRLPVYEANHRHRALLTARRERPRSRAAEERYELTSLQPIEMHPLP
jgi:hypothetical protein